MGDWTLVQSSRRYGEWSYESPTDGETYFISVKPAEWVPTADIPKLMERREIGCCGDVPIIVIEIVRPTVDQLEVKPG